MKSKTILARVTPKASSNKIADVQMTLTGDTQMKVYVTAVPEDGKANKAVLRLVAEHYSLPISKLRLVRGLKGRDKVIEILP